MPVGAWAGSQLPIVKGERSELWTRIAMESVSCGRSNIDCFCGTGRTIRGPRLWPDLRLKSYSQLLAKSRKRTMKEINIMKTISNIIYRAFALFAFACFALSPTVFAQQPQNDPPCPNSTLAPDG